MARALLLRRELTMASWRLLLERKDFPCKSGSSTLRLKLDDEVSSGATMQCPDCATHMMRTHRTLAQKLLYTDAFRCTKCGRRAYRRRLTRGPLFTFAFSSRSHCIRCGTPNVHRMKKRDRIDSMSRHPVSLMLALTGAPLNRCLSCRLQYRDWRRPAGEAPRSG